jgi:hypothetical protein
MTSLTLDQPLPTRLVGKHSSWLSINLHLLPSILTGAMYYLLAEPEAHMGLPSIVSLMIAGCLGMVPFEFGLILWTARNHPDRPRPFMAMIENRQAANLAVHYAAPCCIRSQGAAVYAPKTCDWLGFHI